MARTIPQRRVVHASEVVEDAIKKTDLAKPEAITPARTLALSYEKRIQRQIEMASLALNKYERKLRGGIDLNLDEERMMIAQQDSLRKLETTLQALNAKVNLGDQTDLAVALGMIQHGGTFEQACAAFAHNEKLPQELREALDAK